jgi:hypothetical protein
MFETVETREIFMRASIFGPRFLLLFLGVFCVGCSSEALPSRLEVSASDQSLISAKPSIPFCEPVFDELALVDRAYGLIGMKRVRFDPTNPSVLPSHREYLTQCLALIDQAVVWRVSGFQAIMSNSLSQGDWMVAGDNLVSSLNSLEIPNGLENHAQLLADCFLAYGRFFKRHADGGGGMLGRDWQSDHDLRISSTSIREAYDGLLKLQRQADAHAQTAFYNAHMALDPF